MAPDRPLYNTLEVLGRRWAMRLVWEMRRDAVGFSDLRRRTGISPSVLTDRLRDLGDLGVIERAGSRRYRLTGQGRDLARVLYELNRWAERGREIRPAGVTGEPPGAAERPAGGPVPRTGGILEP